MLAAYGVDLDLAPVVDVNVDPANPVIGIRAFGDDPELVSRHTAAFVEGLQSAGVAACLKHFPGHGNTATDSHRDLPVVDDDRETIERTALPPFRAGIAAGARAVMTAHLVVPAYDTVPATLSRRILTGLLREELGFSGVIVSDGLDMAAIVRRHRLSRRCGAVPGRRRRPAVHRRRPDRRGHRRRARRGDRRRRRPRAAVGRRPRGLGRAGTRPRSLVRQAAGRSCRLVDPSIGLVGGRAGPAGRRRRRSSARARVVLRLGSRPNEAAGVVPWGVGAPMAAHRPDW